MSTLIALLLVFLPLVKSSGSVGLLNTDYKIEEGYVLIAEPYKHLNGSRLSDCIMTCAGSIECEFINVLHKEVMGEVLCEFFNETTIVDANNLKLSENSTFYREVNVIFKDCLEAKAVLVTDYSDIYPIMFPHETPNLALCDMETDGGGWTLLQRRIDGTVDFERDWESYKTGFGNLESNFWLGLNAAHLLTRDGSATLRFDFWEGQSHNFMEYYGATIADETAKYRLNWVSSNGSTIDSLSFHKYMMFSTKDNDNDAYSGECAVLYSGGWWYKNCKGCNLNGIYGATNRYKAIGWKSAASSYGSMSKTEIKIKSNG